MRMTKTGNIKKQRYEAEDQGYDKGTTQDELLNNQISEWLKDPDSMGVFDPAEMLVTRIDDTDKGKIKKNAGYDTKPDMAITLVGQRKTGKTVAVISMLKAIMEIHKIYEIYVCTGTALNGTWQERLPKGAVFDLERFDEMMTKIKSNQILKREMIKKGVWEEKYADRSPWICLVMEDWIQDRKLAKYNKTMDELFTLGRHYYIMVIAISQTIIGSGKNQRLNSDWVGVLGCRDRGSIENVIHEHMGEIQSQNMARELINTVNNKRNYQIFMINKQPYTNGPSERYYRWVADEVPEGEKIGHPKWIKEMEEAEDEAEDEWLMETDIPMITSVDNPGGYISTSVADRFEHVLNFF